MNIRKTELPWLTKYPHIGLGFCNKNIYAEKKEIVGDRKIEFKLLSLTKKGIIIRDVSSGKGKFPKDFDTYKVVNPGDMVFCLFDVDETPRTVGLSNYRGMITGAYDVFGIHGINSKYAYYYYLAFDNLKAYKPLYSGLRKTIPLPSFMATKIPVPPKEEQDQIVHYLDWKTSEIDRFVHQKKKQIKRYEELRQARIDQFSIHGIDNTVSQKDTGLNWLGNIPKHWRMTRLRNNYTLQNGISESGAFFDKGTPFVNYSDVYNNRILPTEFIDVADSKEEQQKVFSVKKGDIFFTRTSETIDDIGIASVCLQDVPKAVFSGFLIRARAFTTDLLPEYVGYYLQSQKVRNYFTKEMNIVIRASLGQNLLKSLYIPVPPKEEQREIIDKLKCILEEFDAIIDGIKREIKLLEELRAKIIADVVTGQIDVRDVVIPEYSHDEDTDADDIEDDEEKSEV